MPSAGLLPSLSMVIDCRFVSRLTCLMEAVVAVHWIAIVWLIQPVVLGFDCLAFGWYWQLYLYRCLQLHGLSCSGGAVDEANADADVVSAWCWLYAADAKAADDARLIVMQYGVLNLGILLCAGLLTLVLGFCTLNGYLYGLLVGRSMNFGGLIAAGFVALSADVLLILIIADLSNS
ncbi:hypothetical protein Nepgr_030068 [Nepenthes gracilis]|uniref:Uncharacterized protein n=1 Tax=Nepenthes gracilis TaxID=150966 RepID=A0AAD3TEP1_NEPGR|nr:hypothetical protein Nepgr_030068 [Nepenthes gracilis]